MTCKEKYIQMMPDCDIDAVIAGSCPHYFCDISKPINCDAATDTEAMSCEMCWDRELPEEVKTE